MAIDIAPLIWRLQRPFLRHGSLAWVALLLGVLATAQVIQIMGVSWSLMRQRPPVSVPAEVVGPAVRQVAPVLPLPRYQQRFELTDDAISAAAGDVSKPLRINFSYQSVPEARLVRQTAAFVTQAEWSELAPLLDRLQGVHRAAYISRLRLSREKVEQAMVEADIQLAIAYLDAPKMPEEK